METVNEITGQDLGTGITPEATEREMPTLPVDGRDSITFRWTTYDLLVDVDRFNSEGEAELTFWSDNLDHRLLLHKTRANLLSPTSTASLVRRLRDLDDGFAVPWNWILTCLTYKVLKNARQGEPVQTIWPEEDDDLTPAYLLEPILYLNHPTVIFGDYGSLKSLFALVVGYVAQLPYTDNKLGLITTKDPIYCLYLDYEDDPLSFRKRWGAIQRGFGI
jgi:hypothetical protein